LFAAAANARIRKHWWRRLSRPVVRIASRRSKSTPEVAPSEAAPRVGDATAPPAPVTGEASVQDSEVKSP
jgi:hypothetical protein